MGDNNNRYDEYRTVRNQLYYYRLTYDCKVVDVSGWHWLLLRLCLTALRSTAVLNLVLQFSNAKFSTAVYDSCWSGAGSLKFSTSSGTSVYIAVRTAVIDITAVVLNLVDRYRQLSF